MNNNYLIRKASSKDIPFIAKTIVEAEKSMTQTIGLAKLFGISELELTNYLTQILEIETDGCEFSLSSFFIAEFDNQAVAAFGGWLEATDKAKSSAFLKSNLINYVFPKEKTKLSNNIISLFAEIQIDRELNTYQLEYAFVAEKHRGNRLINKIIEEMLNAVKTTNSDLKKSQVQVFANNISAIKTYQYSEFKIVQQKKSNNPEIMNYLPHHTKLLMERKL